MDNINYTFEKLAKDNPKLLSLALFRSNRIGAKALVDLDDPDSERMPLFIDSIEGDKPPKWVVELIIESWLNFV